MPRPGLPRAVQLAASAALSLSVFALPWWTLSRPVPTPVLTFDDAASEPRIVAWSATVELEPWTTEAEPVQTPMESDELADRTEPVHPPATKPTTPPTVQSSEPTTDTVRPPASTSVAPPRVEAAIAEAGESATPSPTSRDRAPKRRRAKKKDCRPDVPEIRATGRARWEIERDFVDHYARNLDEANRLAHVSWARNDKGEVIGIKVNRVRCGSPLHEAGIQSGDVVTRINGRKVQSIPQALAAYVALRVKRTLHVRGTRSGRRLDLRYRLT